MKRFPKKTSIDEEAWGLFGLRFGLSRKPTRDEFRSIARYLFLILVGCVLNQWSVVHHFIQPIPSKYVIYFGLAIVVLSGFLLYRMLEKHDLLKAEYERNHKGDTLPD
jgi:hypothetical protein